MKRMGKKDANASQDSPVDHHRKQVGKQNAKKSKKDMKEMKMRADKKKSAMTIKEVVLVCVTFLMVITAVCLFFFWYLGKTEEAAAADKLHPA